MQSEASNLPESVSTKKPGAPLVRLDSSDHGYKEVENLFLKGWKHQNKPIPHIRMICQILSPAPSVITYKAYRARVHIALGHPKNKKPGNEQLLFHGTKRRCLVGEDKDSVYPCSLPDCFLCRVIGQSYDVQKCGKASSMFQAAIDCLPGTRHKFRRFGSGIYTSSCSSKADDYSQNENAKAHFKVLLVNHVVVGKPLKRRRNTNFTQPPIGYHSIVGLPGLDLNYEETVVYTNDAIRPAYLVVYEDGVTSPPDHGPSKTRTILSNLFKTPLTR